ncbi:hypothetical protein SKAU_G00138640 [Synaphobranchus kaupii]|uniref:Uncharacterized protein n=1 Tax=Synaphobranchus kaupii TaxID=118154 RepID=A0A9Q1FSU8_SYNKA|nr:hypothetical protein SKAU_G00138640 [Synaphobranchus kaupii]
MPLHKAEHTELCVFSDASTKAIGAVAYLKTVQKDGQTEVGFVMEENPADHASRSLPASRLAQTTWFSGPSFLRSPPTEEAQTSERFNLIEPENDTEIRPEMKTYNTYLNEEILTPDRFQRFSSLHSLLRGVAFLIHTTRSCKQMNKSSECKGWHRCKCPRTAEELDQAMHVVLQVSQRSAFAKELAALQAQKPIPKNSCL